MLALTLSGSMLTLGAFVLLLVGFGIGVLCAPMLRTIRPGGGQTSDQLYRDAENSLRSANAHLRRLVPHRFSLGESQRSSLAARVSKLQTGRDRLANGSGSRSRRNTRWVRRPLGPDHGLPDASTLAANAERLWHAAENRPVGILHVALEREAELKTSFGQELLTEAREELLARISEPLSANDLIVETGPGRFAVLCGLEDDPELIAQRIRRGITETDFDLQGQPRLITAALGLAVADEHGTVSSWCRQADSALSQAQSQGRNQLVMQGIPVTM